MRLIYRKALLKADHVRMQLGLDMFEPLNIFDTCLKFNVPVKFVDFKSMEGMYIVQEDGTYPTILLSSERPLPRRIFSCGHELGHHIFKHGSRIDGLTDEKKPSCTNDEEEFLVDSFSGALLMPIAGIQAEFAKRNWSPMNSTHIEFYTVCSIFGTGYQTLISHCRSNNLITEFKAATLQKIKPQKIFKDIFSTEVEHSYFKIFDGYTQLDVIDLEVSNYLIIPPSFHVEGNHLKNIKDTYLGTAYKALKPGIVRITSQDKTIGSFVRIQNYKYVGLAENRHLENEII